MQFPQIQIEQQYGKIALDTSPGRHSMESKQGDLQIKQVNAALDISTEAAILEIDSSAAWMALGKGSYREWSQLIQSQLRQQFLTNLSSIVQEGHQLSKFMGDSNPIAEIAKQRLSEHTIIQYTGQASSDNVRVNYTPAEINLNWDVEKVQIVYAPNKPNISYTPGRLDIYHQQQNYIKIDIQNLDMYV